MEKKKICIIGALGLKDLESTTGGQPVKTRMIYWELIDRYGSNLITYVDTYRWKSNPISTFIGLLKNVRKSDVVIMLPARNGVRVFAWLIQVLRKNNSKLFYDVIGGWLPDLLKKNRKLYAKLQRFDGIWVETNTMKKSLRQIGLKNVAVIPNFKRLEIIKAVDMPVFSEAPYTLCTFSRVMEEKGITDAIVAVDHVNRVLGRKAYTLDVYGPIAPRYEKNFLDLNRKYSDFLHYKGIVEPKESTRALKDYFALLFPTRFYTEGVPGTIIDAYAAGVPVICSQWASYADIVDEGITGIAYPFGDNDSLISILLNLMQNPTQLINMKKNCLQRAEQYSPDVVMEKIIRLIES